MSLPEVCLTHMWVCIYVFLYAQILPFLSAYPGTIQGFSSFLSALSYAQSMCQVQVYALKPKTTGKKNCIMHVSLRQNSQCQTKSETIEKENKVNYLAFSKHQLKYEFLVNFTDNSYQLGPSFHCCPWRVIWPSIRIRFPHSQSIFNFP